MQKIIKVTLYSTRQCSYCRQAKTFLKKKKVQFMEFDIQQNQRAFKAFQRLGAKGVPVITIGSTRVDGFNPDKLEQALIRQGLLPSQ